MEALDGLGHYYSGDPLGRHGAVALDGAVPARPDSLTGALWLCQSPAFSIAGAFVVCGGVLTIVLALRSGYKNASTIPLALSILAFVTTLSFVLPQANEFIGYGALCRDIPAGEQVYVREHNRPENMDVYLGRSVKIVEVDDPLPADGVLITKATFHDPALDGRECHLHGESALWLPARNDPEYE